MRAFKDYRKTFNLISVGYILFGLFLVWKPEISLKTICYLFAVLTLIYGIIHLIIYFVRDRMVSVFRYDFVIGIASCVLGVFIFIFPEAVIGVLPITFGIFILISSVMKLQNALDLKRMHYDKWWLVLIFAMIGTICGILLIMRPMWLMKLLIVYAGVILMIDGILSLYSSFCVSFNIRRVRKEMEHAEKDMNSVEVISEDDISIE